MTHTNFSRGPKSSAAPESVKIVGQENDVLQSNVLHGRQDQELHVSLVAPLQSVPLTRSRVGERSGAPIFSEGDPVEDGRGLAATLRDPFPKLGASLALCHPRTKAENNFRSLNAAIVIVDAQALLPLLHSLPAPIDLTVLVLPVHRSMLILRSATAKTWCADMLQNKAIDV